MASVASQLIEEATAHAQSDSVEDARDAQTVLTFRITYVVTKYLAFCMVLILLLITLSLLFLHSSFKASSLHRTKYSLRL